MYESYGCLSIVLPPEKSECRETLTEIVQLLAAAGTATSEGALEPANGRAVEPTNEGAGPAFVICSPGGDKIALPAQAAAALKGMLESLADNTALTIDLLEPRISPKRAACLLELSDSEFHDLIAAGEISCDLSDECPWVKLTDVLVYAQCRATRHNTEVDLLAMVDLQYEMQKKKLYPVR